MWAYQYKKVNTCSEEAICSASQKKKERNKKTPKHTKKQLLKYRKQIMKESKKKTTEEYSPRRDLQRAVVHKMTDYEW